jgi:hypothetical protein
MPSKTVSTEQLEYILFSLIIISTASTHCSVNEMHMLIPTLESFPHYCPYEVLLAHISGQTVNSASIECCRYVLQEAQSRGTWQQELRPIRRALSSLCTKLHFFGLEVSNIRERGCSLTSLTTQGSSLTSVRRSVERGKPGQNIL